jgi:hypothetical protein
MIGANPALELALQLFPFDKPYSIQHDFMKSMIDTVTDGKCGIFESPTGTVSVYYSVFSLCCRGKPLVFYALPWPGSLHRTKLVIWKMQMPMSLIG